VIMILDCCHAGAATARSRGATGVQIRSQDIASAIPFLPHGKVVIAACGGDQLAYEDSRIGHGVFTSHVL
jgi:hypothetical protein